MCRMEDSNRTLEVACFSPCPVHSLRLPSLWTEGRQVDLCHLCHRPRSAEVLTRSARVCFLARLADSIDKVCQGQRSTEGLDHASGDAPYRSSAKPPPLAGLSPAHGAFQEHAAHTIEWSMMLSSNGSSSTCIPEVLPHSSMPLARRTERTLEAVSSRPGVRPSPVVEVMWLFSTIRPASCVPLCTSSTDSSNPPLRPLRRAAPTPTRHCAAPTSPRSSSCPPQSGLPEYRLTAVCAMPPYREERHLP